MQNIILTTEEFNKRLFELLCDENDDIDDEEVCLISGNKLEKNHVTLICSHRFNYKCIFNEIKRQKNFSNLETCKLKKYQLKCPYCRTIQNGVLFHKEHYPKLDGINWPESKFCKSQKCKAIIKIGKLKGQTCGKPCYMEFCNRHNKKNIQHSDTITCNALLKSGKRKGQICGCICKTAETKALKLCKRHNKNM